mgnify:FL=1
MSMGFTLSQYIHKTKQTKRKFAHDIGFGEATVYKWCNDDVPIPLDQIALLAEYFSDILKEPPNVIIFKFVLQDSTVRAVLASYRRSQQK